MKTLWISFVSALFLVVAGCGDTRLFPVLKTEKREGKEIKIVKMQDALFCFKCHSAKRYAGEGGGFPHLKHIKEFGLHFHCNQCHDFKGHHPIQVIKKTDSPCSNCH